MKVLIVHYRYFISGGPERYLFNVKKALEDRGHIVIPFSIKNCQNEKTKYKDYFVDNIGKSDEIFINKYPKTVRTYIDLIGREFYSFKVQRQLERLIKAELPDVCYLLVYKRALSPSVVNACVKNRIKIINRISDYNTVCGAGSLYRDGQYCELCLNGVYGCVRHKCIKGSFIFSMIRALSVTIHKVLRVSNKVNDYVCTNQYMEEMMRRYGYDTNKLHVIPTFFKEDSEIKLWDKSNEIVDGKVKFLFIGNVDESKGIYDLLEAITGLRKHTKAFHLYIVGGLHMEENIRVMNIVKKGAIEDSITFVPFINGTEVFRFYLKTNVTILPARWVENLPNTLVESLYFNRPVVVPELGSFKYTTDASVSYRYKPLSVDDLFKCLLGICGNHTLIKIKSKNCKRYFNNNYTEEVHMQRLTELLSRGKDNENI